MHTGRSRAGHLSGTPVSCSTARAASPRLPLVPHGAGRRSWVPPRRLRADWQLGSSCRKSTGAAPCGSSASRESPARETRALRVGGRGTRAAGTPQRPSGEGGQRRCSAPAPCLHPPATCGRAAAAPPAPRPHRRCPAAIPAPRRPPARSWLRGKPEPRAGAAVSGRRLPGVGRGCPGAAFPRPTPAGGARSQQDRVLGQQSFCSS